MSPDFGIIRTDARGATNAFHALTNSTLEVLNMAKESLPKICTKEKCNDIVAARGLCVKHYDSERRSGGLTSPLVNNLGVGDTEEERFWSRVAKTADANDCWNWLAGRDGNGYGCVSLNGKSAKTSRAAWFYTYGAMPTLLVLHSCDNRICCNPNHLREGTAQDNMDDKVRRNRQPRGEAQGAAKLTEAQVIEIRRLYAVGDTSQRKLAVIFGVNQKTIGHVLRRTTWTHI